MFLRILGILSHACHALVERFTKRDPIPVPHMPPTQTTQPKQTTRADIERITHAINALFSLTAVA